MLFSDHEALKYVNGQQELNTRHAKWLKSLQVFYFVLKHKAEKVNQVANALCRKPCFLSAIKNVIVGLDHIKELYEIDPNFGSISSQCGECP